MRLPNTHLLVVSARNAVEIYSGGACNPTAIVNHIAEAVKAAREFDGTDAKGPNYAPARLMIAQLCWLTGQGIGDYPALKEDLKYCEDLINNSF